MLTILVEEGAQVFIPIESGRAVRICRQVSDHDVSSARSYNDFAIISPVFRDPNPASANLGSV